MRSAASTGNAVAIIVWAIRAGNWIHEQIDEVNETNSHKSSFLFDDNVARIRTLKFICFLHLAVMVKELRNDN